MKIINRTTPRKGKFVLSELKEELQAGVTSCISGYIGFITHPQRERLTKDVCKRIGDILEENFSSEEDWLKVIRSAVLKSAEKKWEWRYEKQLSLTRALEDNAVKLRKEIRTLKKGIKNE